MYAPLSVLLSSNGMQLETKINSSVNSKIFSKRLIIKDSQNNPIRSRIILNNDSYIIDSNIENNNGIIHIISKILIPPVFVTNFGQYLFKKEEQMVQLLSFDELDI